MTSSRGKLPNLSYYKMSNVLDEVVEGFEPLPDVVSVMAGSKIPTLLSLDIGTSGIRAALFDERGSEVAGASVRINSRSTMLADLGTIEAEVLLEQVAQAVDALFAKSYESFTRVELMAISCFWHSLVGVDQTGQATTPVFGWADSRAAAAARQLRSELDEAKFHQRTGCRFHPSYWPAKLLRVRNEQPEVFRQTSRWLSFADYLTLHFFGETLTSVSMASGSGLLNQRTCEWETELSNALDLHTDQLPDIASPNGTLNKLTRAYALRWPQLSEARLFPAIGDGAANNIGAGCSSLERIALMVGTSGAMRVLYAGTPPDQLPSQLFCYRADRDRVITGGALSDGGNLYSWIRNSLLNDYDSESIENELEGLEPDGHGLTVLPFWSGERSTGWTPEASGAILGLTLRTLPIEVLRAAMEAIAYRFALIAQALEPLAPEAQIIASGYALRSSSVWVQILADVLGRHVAMLELPEASTRGAALLALEGAGKIQSIGDFVVPVDMIFEPDMSRHSRYQTGRERQQQIYEQIIQKNRSVK